MNLFPRNFALLYCNGFFLGGGGERYLVLVHKILRPRLSAYMSHLPVFAASLHVALPRFEQVLAFTPALLFIREHRGLKLGKGSSGDETS